MSQHPPISKICTYLQGGQDIMSMMGQLMKPRKTEITGLFVTDFHVLYSVGYIYIDLEEDVCVSNDLLTASGLMTI